MSGMRILGTGSALPSKRMTNEDYTKIVDTSDEWISARTGIKNRFHLSGDETNTSLALEASRRAIADAGIDKSEIGTVIVATFTSDHTCPITACMLQSGLELSTDITAFDLSSGCSGFVIALEAAYGIMLTGRGKYALIVGSECLSRVINFEDRSTCVLFGDGAGAVIAELSDEKAFYSVTGAEGKLEVLHVHGITEPNAYISMDGKAVFRFATGIIPKCINQLLDEAGLGMDDIDWFVFHQANKRIISHVGKKLKIPEDRLFCNIEELGNTSAASVPLALDEMNRKGLLKSGQRIITVAFGGGLTWGGALLKW